jgi:hypothetical protein
VTEVLARVGRPVRAYVRAGPVTASFLVLLVVAHAGLVLSGALAPVRTWASTNVENLGRHPVGSLAGSLVFLDNSGTITAGTVLTVGLGVGVALWWLESRHGPVTAGVAFLGGHVGATAVTALVIVGAVGAGRYPPAVLTAVDVGISYGAQAATACAVVLLARWASVAGIAFVLVWPVLDARWAGPLPDFTTVGHLVAALVGFAVGVVVRRRAAYGP